MAKGGSAVQRIAHSFMRRAYWVAQRGLCPLCGKRLAKGTRPRPNSTNLNWDHVWPRSRSAAHGELGHAGGLLLVHEKCNTAKGNRRPTGCEQLMLFAVNRAVGYAPHETALWDGPPVAPWPQLG